MSYDSYRGSAGGRGGDSNRGSGYRDDYHSSSNSYRGGYRGRGGGRGGRGLPYRGGRGSYNGGYNSQYYGSPHRGRGGGHYNKFNSFSGHDDRSRGSSYSENEEREEGQSPQSMENRQGSVEYDEDDGGGLLGPDASYGRGGRRGGRGGGRGGDVYRGGSFRGSGYKSRNGSIHHSGEFYRSGGVVDKSSRHYKDFLHDTKLKEFQNPWINIMGITDEAQQASLEANYNEQTATDETIRELQRKKMKLEMAISSLEKHAAREELHVQLTTEKLDEFVYM
ncbi:Transcriptional regulatory protein LGE1 family protein [Candida parapsilosis]|uniref:Transcription regulator LGE1 helical region domain-containing protein n=2 Tax=Candida parapsilosis TaxID=5480 RepID=G8BG77_CANPC|nr:uncharacterized protein CPAR2_205040 [Candida parapsilosis]KAF6054991.1 Transcriptional regulatory protein LGE1 family protein [Candida parapsilosis]KAF6055986.1 Transcriptional regulatory protein LGE1 family protein [Candida parapsilosis]KAF6058916.1 Transcriptional regulatory protein LGE1 family protein [Candida parapsilosis]KAF6067673.1 Transcriptional regulatory protein LGE1 family protein [Candida parapsilosis]KAI5901902.1 hypothetical protein K4G60_g1041 [Candida parapsilosis]